MLLERHVLVNFALHYSIIMQSKQEYSSERVLKTLQKVDIFRNIPSEMLAHIAGNMVIARYHAGENIISKGEDGDSMFVILDGKVKIHDDDFMVMALGPNDFFGEIALLTSMKRISSVTADTNCTVGVVTRADFYNVLSHYPDVTKDIMTALCMRILKQNETLINFLKSREHELMRLVEERTEELQEAQRQQFLQEKMASLGQLSSGIAHEIKNPLNFVNNFSVLTKELLEDLRKEQDNTERLSIIHDAGQNLDRIIEHGKRADSILNKLTQISDQGSSPHSRVDINTLVGEVVSKTCARFSADHPGFTCSVTMVFTKNIPLILVPREDLARSMGFIITNALESLEEKRSLFEEGSFRPHLFVETEIEDETIKVIITDNGVGIKEENIGQIFLPFFTTKPTRRNTGVGLTLADNSVRGMKGRIEVTPSWSDGARFVLVLPATA
jgi:C4-dicarboxylate-specific signal transduction histidine kinase